MSNFECALIARASLSIAWSPLDLTEMYSVVNYSYLILVYFTAVRKLIPLISLYLVDHFQFIQLLVTVKHSPNWAQYYMLNEYN